MNTTVYQQAHSAWLSWADTRQRRQRLKHFTFGRQWDDPVPGRPGQTLTEGAWYESTGRHPITNNLLRPLVKSVVGRFRQSIQQRGAGDRVMEALRRANRLDELDARALEEFLISGCAVQRVGYEHRFDGEGVWVDNVNPARFFCNHYRDPRATDLRLVGMLHDMTLEEMKLRFGHGNRRRQRELAAVWSKGTATGRREGSVLAAALGTPGGEELMTFTQAGEAGLCRVVEVWTLEDTGRGACGWHCRYFGPDGVLLDQTPSPYPHRSHPFVLSLYPLTDGEVHPFIEDVIDQQKHINKLITCIDHILAHSAKGVLLFPQDALAPGYSFSDILDIWGNPGAVIPVSSKARAMPSELYSPGRSEGASQLLDLELKMFQQVSGVTSALQGHTVGSNVSASLYESQVANGSVALLDVFETFNTFRSVRDDKMAATAVTP